MWCVVRRAHMAANTRARVSMYKYAHVLVYYMSMEVRVRAFLKEEPVEL